MQHYAIETSITRKDDNFNKYVSEVAKIKLLTLEEETDLARRSREGDLYARKKLVSSNLRFVISIAKQYQHGKIPLSDLISEGNIGLMRAAEKFDETRGFKFISYAVWWVRQFILQFIATNSMIRIPSNQHANKYKITIGFSKLEQHLERDPSVSELAVMLNIDESDLQMQMNSFIPHASLSATVEEDLTLADVIPDTETIMPDSKLKNNSSLSIELARSLSRLTPREKYIVVQHYGIGTTSRVMENIADELKLTKERVRQILYISIRKLRRRNSLREFL